MTDEEFRDHGRSVRLPVLAAIIVCTAFCLLVWWALWELVR